MVEIYGNERQEQEIRQSNRKDGYEDDVHEKTKKGRKRVLENGMRINKIKERSVMPLRLESGKI